MEVEDSECSLEKPEISPPKTPSECEEVSQSNEIEKPQTLPQLNGHPKGKICRKCIICTVKLLPPTEPEEETGDEGNKPKLVSDSSDEELAVVFFLRKFLEHPLIPEESLQDLLSRSNTRKKERTDEKDDLDNPQDDPEDDENSSKRGEKGLDWIWFCPCCLQSVQDARNLCIQIAELEMKLISLREEVVDKVVSTIIKEGQRRSRRSISKDENVTISDSHDKGKGGEEDDEEDGDPSPIYQNVRNTIYQKKTGLSFTAEQNEVCPASFVEVKVKAECSSDSWDDQFEDPMTPAWHNQGLFDEDGQRISTNNNTTEPGESVSIGDALIGRGRRGRLQLQDVVIRPSKRKKLTKKRNSKSVEKPNPTLPKRGRGRPRKVQKVEEEEEEELEDTSLLDNEDSQVTKEEDTTRKRYTPRRSSQKKVNYREIGGGSDNEEMYFKVECPNETDYYAENELDDGAGGSEAHNSEEELEAELKPKVRKRGRPRKHEGAKTYIKKKKKKSRDSDGNACTDPLDPAFQPRDNRGLGKCTVESRTCPVCKRIFINPSKMLVHLNVKHERKILFHCEICNRGFLRKDYLREHKKVHLSPEEKQLEKARRECGIRKKKVRRIGTADGEEGPTLNCSICKSTFETVPQMHRHINYFHGKTEGYTCEVCQKKFQWKDGLKKHMKVFHEGTKKFKCTWEGCGSAFYYKKHLQVHERIHTGAKDFLCAMCGVSFRHEWSFNRHNIFKHHKVTSKTYLCETCGKSFKIKSHLDQHLQSKSHGGAGLKRRIRNRNKINSQGGSSKGNSNSVAGTSNLGVSSGVSSTEVLLGLSSPVDHNLKQPEEGMKTRIEELPLNMGIGMDLQNRLTEGTERIMRMGQGHIIGSRIGPSPPDPEDDADTGGGGDVGSSCGSSLASHSPIPPPVESDTNTNSCGVGDNESQEGNSRGGDNEYMRYSSGGPGAIHMGHGPYHHIHPHGHHHHLHSQQVSPPPPQGGPPPTNHPPIVSTAQLYDALAHYQQHQQGAYSHPGYVSPPNPGGMHHHQQH